MSIEWQPTQALLRRAIECALQGHHQAARSVLASIDSQRLISERKAALRLRRTLLARTKIWGHPTGSATQRVTAQGLKRVPVPVSTMLATFQRDKFVCRYSHCGKRTIYVPVLRALSALFPDLITYNSNWRPFEDHILYWTFGASVDHAIPFPHGGTSDPQNLITACYQCNDLKNMLLASDLGWTVGDIDPDDDWDGLMAYLSPLDKARRTASRASPAKGD